MIKNEIKSVLDVNCPDQTMSLIEAIKWKNYELADQLITNGYGLNETDYDGYTPLMLLLYKLRKTDTVCLELFTKLIDAGADVNIEHCNGWTALVFAAFYDHSVYTVRMLIDAGADVNYKGNNWTALKYTLVYERSIYTVRILIDAGADVNVKDNGGGTALLYAVIYERSIYIVRMLIDAGADLNIKTNSGHTALTSVKNHRTYSSVDSVKMLIEADF